MFHIPIEKEKKEKEKYYNFFVILKTVKKNYIYTKINKMIFNSIILGMFGGQEIIIIALIVLLLFGGTKIPQLMRGLGRGMNEFKKAKDGIYDDLDVDKTSESNKKETSSNDKPKQ